MTSIDETIKLGNEIISNGLPMSRFVNYKSKVQSIATILKDEAILEKKSVLPMVDDLITKSEENYKLNVLVRFFYFKKYQYKYVVNPWTNKPEHIKLRYVIETNEILENLLDSLSR